MKFSDLIACVPGIRSRTIPGHRARPVAEILGLTPRLRNVRAGMAFFVLPEESRANPHVAHAAYARGASLVVCGPELAVPAGLSTIRVSDPCAALATAAAAFQAFPADRLTLIAVTGEARVRRGVAAVLSGLLNNLGVPTSRFGPQGFEVAGRCGNTPLQSLDAAEFHALMSQQVLHGGRCVITEFEEGAQPEALTGLHFAHRFAVTETQIFQHLRPLRLNPRGSQVEIWNQRVPVTSTTPLVGRRSILALDHAWSAALSLAKAFGHRAEAVQNTLPILPPIAGWLEPVACGQPFGVLVDHATTAEALTSALRDGREMTRGRLLIVLGARAAASPEENAALGQAAFNLADHVHVTSDNPRRRSPQELSRELLGEAETTRMTRQLDRPRAIQGALRNARAGDVVILAGKADAPIQELDQVILPFDDRIVAASALHARGYVGGGN